MNSHLGKNNPFASELVSPFAKGVEVRRRGILGDLPVGVVINHFRVRGHWMLTVRFGDRQETFLAETYTNA